MVSPALRLALIGGPAYKPIYRTFRKRAGELGIELDIHLAPNHARLNELIADCIRRGELPYDLISTHIKYAPFQAAWLQPLDEHSENLELDQFVPDVLEHCRVNGQLVQLPRLTDARLLHINTSLVPESFGTWDELAARVFQVTDAFGFAFPGNASGLFGTFYELMVSAGGTLVDADGQVALETDAAVWALDLLYRLHSVEQVTPEVVPGYGFDEVSTSFRNGDVAIIGDWPGYFGMHIDPRASVVSDHLRLERYPVGPAGKRAVYSGSHSFAITTTCQDLPAAIAMLREMVSFESQLKEARGGAFSPRRDVQAQIRQKFAGDSLRSRQLDLLVETIANDMLMFPSSPHYPDVEEAVAPLLLAAVRGELVVREALTQSSASATSILGGK